MNVIVDPLEIYPQIDFLRIRGKRIGLVPTMGALHQGHLSLVQRARAECDVVVATIFVNPAQFGPNEDFAKYPRTVDDDLSMLQGSGCDYVFAPTHDRIYSESHSTYVDPPKVGDLWEGSIRPGHFRGVTTIVLKLFMMIPAHIAFFGQKDYQQVAVIRAMVEDLNLPIRIETCDTIRELDGLAMSSRNRYLSVDERSKSLALWRALQTAQRMVDEGITEVAKIESTMREILHSAPVSGIDYASIVDATSMQPISNVVDSSVAIIAARLGSTRLIDNRVLRMGT